MPRLFCIFFMLQLLSGVNNASGQSAFNKERYALAQQTINFMHSLQGEVQDLKQLSHVSDSAIAKEIQTLPFFIKTKSYLHENAALLEQQRKAALQQLEPTPEQLKHTTWTPLKEDHEVYQLSRDTAIAQFLLMQIITPEQLIRFTQALIFPELLEAESPEQQQRIISIANIFGSRIFAEQVQQNSWQLWAVNHAFSFNFVLDVQQMSISNIAYSKILPSDISTLAGDIKASKASLYQSDRIQDEMNSIRWNSFPKDADPEHSSHVLYTLPEQALQKYYANNKQHFQAVRQHILMDPSMVKHKNSTFTHQEDSISLDENSNLYIQAYALFPQDVTEQIWSYFMSMGYGTTSDELMFNSILGSQHQASPTKDPVLWKIASNRYKSLLTYTWNIATGAVTDVSFSQTDN